MIKYLCDWCRVEFARRNISIVTVKNLFNKKATLHICSDCGKQHMPAWLHANLSWTATNDND